MDLCYKVAERQESQNSVVVAGKIGTGVAGMVSAARTAEGIQEDRSCGLVVDHMPVIQPFIMISVMDLHVSQYDLRMLWDSALHTHHH